MENKKGIGASERYTAPRENTQILSTKDTQTKKECNMERYSR